MKGNRAETNPYTCPPSPRLGIDIVNLSRHLGETKIWAAISRGIMVCIKYFLLAMFAFTFK